MWKMWHAGSPALPCTVCKPASPWKVCYSINAGLLAHVGWRANVRGLPTHLECLECQLTWNAGHMLVVSLITALLAIVLCVPPRPCVSKNDPGLMCYLCTRNLMAWHLCSLASGPFPSIRHILLHSPLSPPFATHARKAHT